MQETLPWIITIKYCQPGENPRIIVSSDMVNKFIRGPEIARRIEYFLVHSGRQFVSISLGLMFSTRTDDYYLGVVLDQPNLPKTIVHNEIRIENRDKWINKNVHVVIAYVGMEVECTIRNGNFNDCEERYAVNNVVRFSLRERIKPILIPHEECGIHEGRKICFKSTNQV